MDNNAESYYDAARQLPEVLSRVLLRLAPEQAACITELRLRSDRPVLLTTPKGYLAVNCNGTIAAAQNTQRLETSHMLLQECFHALCGYSVHSYSESIAQGFIPMHGGHRAGVCGTAVCTGGSIDTIKNITSLNIRVARPLLTACDSALLSLLQGHEGILLAGAPGSGKTTVLRAAMLALSQMQRAVAVVDERFELAPVDQNGFTVPIPLCCDILSGYPKHIGMLHALRSLAPDTLLCDEIGSMEEVRAVEQAANAGVRIIATLHGETVQAVLRRPQAKALLQTGAFAYMVFLQGADCPGTVKGVETVAHIFQGNGRAAAVCGGRDDRLFARRTCGTAREISGGYA